VEIKEQKEEKERTCLTVGGDQIEYPGDKSTRTVGLIMSNILINSTISTKGAQFLIININNNYLITRLGRYKYMVINLTFLPQEAINVHNLIELAHGGRVYIDIQKVMYGLPQVGVLAHELLQQ
jgi:hypothetical protein